MLWNVLRLLETFKVTPHCMPLFLSQQSINTRVCTIFLFPFVVDWKLLPPYSIHLQPMYSCLTDDLELPACLRVWFSDVDVSKESKVWKAVYSTALSARCIDFMWRLVSASLKTGSVVGNLIFSGARSDCAFWEKKLETMIHIVLECASLRSAWSLIEDTVFSQYGFDLDECIIAAVFDAEVLAKAVEKGGRCLLVLMIICIWDLKKEIRLARLQYVSKYCQDVL